MLGILPPSAGPHGLQNNFIFLEYLQWALKWWVFSFVKHSTFLVFLCYLSKTFCLHCDLPHFACIFVVICVNI